nr:ATP-grasp domain-containing protein [Bacillus sp. FJAT-49736]
MKTAERLGYFTVVFTQNKKQIKQRKEYTEVHEMIYVDMNDLTKMKEEINKLLLRGKDIKTIVSFIDSYVYIASILCEEYCHNYSSPTANKIMEDKLETRLFLKDQPYTPKFLIINPNEPFSLETMDFAFPVMVKFPKSTGSKDVLFASDSRQLEKQLADLQEKNPDEMIIIEEYIEGDQYLVEALVYKSKIHIAGIMEQEITKGERFIITGYGVLAKAPTEIKKEIEDVLKSVVLQLDIKDGALHLELRRTNNGWKLIEINPRISGGAMNSMLQAAFGFNLVEETLKLYLGKTPSLVKKCSNYVFTQYVIVSNKGTLEKITGKNKALKSPGVVEVYVKPKKGTVLTPPLSMGHRYAYVIAAAESMAEAKKLAKSAANKITFHLNSSKTKTTPD